MKAEPPIMSFSTRAAWTRWLAAHHTSSAGVWLKIAKNGAPSATVSYPEALEVALCYGWIDGQKGALHEGYWRQRFTPRSARSRWSRRNRDIASDLIERGAMQAAGLREVERARADGRWASAYESQRTATVPEDLQRALDDDPAAKAFFAGIDAGNRYAILYRIEEAKKPETRARRIAQHVAMLHEGRTIHP